MERFLINILAIIDKSMSQKLSRLERRIKANRYEFDRLVDRNKEVQNKILELYNTENEDVSTSDQIGLMFRMVENDPQLESFENFDISKIISEDKTLSQRHNESKNLTLDCSNMLISESFRKKNPHEISSEQIFGESISNINYASSIQNNYMSMERKFIDVNVNEISNLKNNTSSMIKQKEPSDFSYTIDSRQQNDNRIYNYSESENDRIFGSPSESQLKKMGNFNNQSPNLTGDLPPELGKSKQMTRTSSNTLLSRTTEKTKIKRRSRSKSRSKILNEATKPVEVIMEVDQEYKEKSSHWSQSSLMREGESMKEIARDKGLNLEELGISKDQVHSRNKSEISNKSSQQLSIEINYSKNKPISSEHRSKQSSINRTPQKEKRSEGTISTKKVSWSKFSQEMIKENKTEWSKSQATQNLEPLTHPHKQNKSAVYDKIYEQYLKKAPTNQFEIDRKFRMHRQNPSNFSAEIRSLHTYKNSLVSRGNYAVSDGLEDSQQNNASIKMENWNKLANQEKKSKYSDDALIQIKGDEDAKNLSINIYEDSKERIDQPQNPFLQLKKKKSLIMTPLNKDSQVKIQRRLMLPRRSSLDFETLHSSTTLKPMNQSMNRTMFQKSRGKAPHHPDNPKDSPFKSVSSNNNLNQNKPKNLRKDIKIDVLYRTEEPESIRASEKTQKERFNRAVSRGRLNRRESGNSLYLRRRSMSKSILETIKLKKQKDEEEEEEKKKKKKKIKFTEPIFKKEDLIEAYDNLMKEKDKEKQEGGKPVHKKERHDSNKKKPTKRETSKAKKKPPIERRKSIVKFDKKSEAVFSKRASSPMLYKDFNRGMTQFLDEKGMKKNATSTLKKVAAKVDTGLKHIKSKFEDEDVNEKRRVKKDYTMDGIILPQIRMDVYQNFELFMAAQDMNEILMVQEPEPMDLGHLVEKAGEDNVDYVSEFDAKDHIGFHQKNILSEYDFDFGMSMFSQTTNTCSEVNNDQFTKSSLIYQKIEDSPEQSSRFLKKMKRKKNLHEKNESIVINKKNFHVQKSRENLNLRRSKKFQKKKKQRVIDKYSSKGFVDNQPEVMSIDVEEEYEVEPSNELLASMVSKGSKRSFKSPKLNRRFKEDAGQKLPRELPSIELNLYDASSKNHASNTMKLTKSDIFGQVNQVNPMTRSHNKIPNLKHSRGYSNKIGSKKHKKNQKSLSKHKKTPQVIMVKNSAIQKKKKKRQSTEFSKKWSNPNFYTNNIYNPALNRMQNNPNEAVDLYAQPQLRNNLATHYSTEGLRATPKPLETKDEEFQFNISKPDNRVKPAVKRRSKPDESMHLDFSVEQDPSLSEQVTSFVGSVRENYQEFMEPKKVLKKKNSKKKMRRKVQHSNTFNSKQFKTMTYVKKNSSQKAAKRRNNSQRLKPEIYANEAQAEEMERKNAHLRHRTMGQMKHIPGVEAMEPDEILQKTEILAPVFIEKKLPKKLKNNPPLRRMKKGVASKKLPLGGSPLLIKKKVSVSRKSNSSSNNQVNKASSTNKVSTPRHLFPTDKNNPFKARQKKLGMSTSNLTKPKKLPRIFSNQGPPKKKQKPVEEYEFELTSSNVKKLITGNPFASPQLKKGAYPPRKAPLIGTRNRASGKKLFKSPPLKGMHKSSVGFRAKMGGGLKKGGNLRISRDNMKKSKKIGYDSSDEST